MKWFKVLSMQMFNDFSKFPASAGTTAGREKLLPKRPNSEP
jgi:hypothetical protein